MTALPSLPRAVAQQNLPYRVADPHLHLDVVVPQLVGRPLLNRRLTAVAEALATSYRRTVRTEKADRPGSYHSLKVSWQLVGHSTQATGVQLWVAEQHGERVTMERVTVWSDTGRVLALPDLFTPQAWPAVEKAVVGALSGHSWRAGSPRQALLARAAPEGAGPAFGFSADGGLVITFSPRALSSGTKPVSVGLTGTGTVARLSAAGRAVRAAALTHPTPTVARPAVDCTRRKCVALTFDDGPGPFTAELVALLQQQRVPATFFLVGARVRQSPDLLAVQSAAGMEVGNHSSNHSDLTKDTAATMTRDLTRTSDAINAVTGRDPTLLRPPYGARNRTVDRVGRQLRMAEILWDVDTLDWRYRDPVRVRRVAVASARPGSIILMHDIHRTTITAVPGIIVDLRRRGFVLVTVSQLLGGHPGPGRVYSHQATAPGR